MDKLAARDRAAATELRIQSVRVRVRRMFERPAAQAVFFIVGFVAVVIVNSLIENF